MGLDQVIGKGSLRKLLGLDYRKVYKPKAPKLPRVIKHGIHIFLKSGVIPCHGCILASECAFYNPNAECKVILDFQKEKIKEILELPWVKQEDSSLVEMLARELAIQAIILKYLSRKGIIDEKKGKLDLQPIMTKYWISVQTATRMMNELGLTPKARKELGLDMERKFDIAMELQTIKEEK